jgi:hypothetical protein
MWGRGDAHSLCLSLRLCLSISLVSLLSVSLSLSLGLWLPRGLKGLREKYKGVLFSHTDEELTKDTAEESTLELRVCAK